MKISTKNLKFPFHIVKRSDIPLWKSMLFRVIAIVSALILSTVISIFMINANPLKFISTMFLSAFDTVDNVWILAKDTAVLLCIALAITPAFKMRFWNIGAEGQTLIGALGAATVVFYLQGVAPEWLIIILMLVTSIVAGAIWAGLPGLFKAFWGTNETLFTLMMNYIAAGLVNFIVQLWKGRNTTLPQFESGRLPIIFNEYLLLIFIVLGLAAALYIYQKYTKHGYEISVVGESENTANYIGINVKWVLIRTMIISGAICGIAGFLIVGAVDHSINYESTVGGLGFTAIMVSWLAKFNPLVMIGTSAFIAFLTEGASNVVDTFNIESSFPNIVVGIILFFVIGCEFFINYEFKSTNRVGAKKENSLATTLESENKGGEKND